MREPTPANSAVLLTPPQAAAIATLRLSGSLVDSFVAKHLSKAPSLQKCTHCQMRDGDVLIDDPVAVLIRPGCVELHVHAGPWIIRATLELVERFGFTIRSWESAVDLWIDSDDAIERQMLADVHRAGTREALAILLAQPAAWRAMLQKREPEEISRAKADRSLSALLNPPTVAIVGLPNVGKSTLANALFAKSHSITADLPGTTRDWVGEKANIDGLIVTLIDTPGQRTTTDAIEAAAIKKAVAHVTTADLVLLIEDAASPIDAETERLRTQYPDAIRVLNKCDIAAAWTDASAIRVSAKNNAGLHELRRAILAAFGCDDLASLHARCWTAAQRNTLD